MTGGSDAAWTGGREQGHNPSTGTWAVSWEYKRPGAVCASRLLIMWEQHSVMAVCAGKTLYLAYRFTTTGGEALKLCQYVSGHSSES